MESRLRNLRRAVSRAVRNVKPAATAAHLRLPRAALPKLRSASSSVAVIDIGSNSVRLVVYEALTRNLSPIFNEKTLCGLGREVQSLTFRRRIARVGTGRRDA